MARKSSLFINKKTDKNGNNYYIDRDTGKRRSNEDYRAQWNGNKGRVNKQVFEESVKQFEAFERTRERGEKVDIQTIVRGVQEMETKRDQYKSHQEMLTRANQGEELNEYGEKQTQMEGKTSLLTLYHGVKDNVKGIGEDQTIKILSPDGTRYQTVDKTTALSMVSDYIQNVTRVNDELEKNTPKGKTAPYVLPLIAMEYDMDSDTWKIDLKNAFGMEGNEGILNEINDMFE